jgi:hypothetical protein
LVDRNNRSNHQCSGQQDQDFAAAGEHGVKDGRKERRTEEQMTANPEGLCNPAHGWTRVEGRRSYPGKPRAMVLNPESGWISPPHATLMTAEGRTGRTVSPSITDYLRLAHGRSLMLRG